VVSDINTASNAESEEFTLAVTGLDGNVVTHANLAMNPSSPNFYGTRVNIGPAASEWVKLQPYSPPTISLPPDDIPKKLTAATPLAGGQDENLSTIGPTDYQNGLDTLVAHKDVNMVAIPDSQAELVQGHLLDHCQNLLDRFAIIDSVLGAGVTGTGSVSEQEGSIASQHGYAALYYPWLLVEQAPPPPGSPPGPPAPYMLVPPSGHVAGIYARTDFERGVHKAPAGEGADVRGVIGLERRVSDTEQGILNLNYGVNVIRSFRPKGRPVVWGARTTATGLDNNWQYINVRRLFLYIEGSIQVGIRYAVFEPNTEALWSSLTQSLTAFLTQVWRDGALFGSSPKEAFYVRIDKVLNPPSEQQLGRLWIEIGVRPAYPAEFIIVRVGIWLGGSQVSES
jgi:phage tail sheath protein FI